MSRKLKLDAAGSIMIGMIASLPRAYEFISNLLQEDAKFKEKESFARISYNETEAKAHPDLMFSSR